MATLKRSMILSIFLCLCILSLWTQVTNAADYSKDCDVLSVCAVVGEGCDSACLEKLNNALNDSKTKDTYVCYAAKGACYHSRQDYKMAIKDSKAAIGSSGNDKDVQFSAHRIIALASMLSYNGDKRLLYEAKYHLGMANSINPQRFLKEDLITALAMADKYINQ